MEWLMLIENCLLLLWVMATTWLLLENRDRLVSMELLLHDAKEGNLPKDQTRLYDFMGEEE